jgi:GntR family transcriptional regulator, transcriptional repressor for pyruvate dehydrogenase complex
MFTKVRQVRAFESIIQQVEAAILKGRLAVGDRLPPERELQGMLDVSRNTLRESLRVLEQKGLIEVRKGNRGGVFVKEINADSMTESLGLFVQSQRITMEQISEFRQDLEGLATRRAAVQADPARMSEVERLLEKAEDLARQGPAQWDAFMQADRDVHLALARLAGNPLHHFFLETVHTHFHRYHIQAYLPRDEETIQATLRELKAIVQAVSRGEPARAEALARGHVRRATQSMQQASAAAAKKAAAPRPTVRRLKSKPNPRTAVGTLTNRRPS